MTKIEFRHVSFTYPGNPSQILSDVSLTFNSGERVAIIGQNGAGKTTLIKQLNGLLTPTEGKVLVDGVPVEDRPTCEWANRVGYVFQNPNDQLFLDSVKKELLFGVKHAKLNGVNVSERLTDIAETMGLESHLSDHPLDLSNVQKKFCAIGSILMMDPDIVVLDEPTGGQDYFGNKRLSELLTRIHQQGKICLTVSHDMKFVSQNFERVVVMAHGRVVLDGSPAEVFSNNQVLEEAKITAPPLMTLAQRLNWTYPVLTQSEFIEAFKQKIE